MRVLVAEFGHESNSFAPGLLSAEDFLTRGDPVRVPDTGGSAAGATSYFQHQSGCDVVLGPTWFSFAGPHVRFDAAGPFLEEMVRLWRQQNCTAMVLALHGACVAEDGSSLDEMILGRLREAVGPDVPIALALDHHANLVPGVVDLAQIIVGDRTQPHDQVDTGHEAARLLHRFVENHERQHFVSTIRIPWRTHQEQFRTAKGPMKVWFDMARQFEQTSGVTSISLFPAQPWLDVEDFAWTILVYARSSGQADETARLLAASLIEMQARFPERAAFSVEEALDRVTGDGCLIIADSGDSHLGGATGESTEILSKLLVSKPVSPGLVGVVDAAAIASFEGVVAGQNRHISLHGHPLGEQALDIEVSAVSAVEEMQLVAPFTDRNVRLSQGKTIAVRERSTGHILVIAERAGLIGVHPNAWKGLVADDFEPSFIIAKTVGNTHYLNGTDMVLADTFGPTTSQIDNLQWQFGALTEAPAMPSAPALSRQW